jgi:hypothetical protein
MKEGELDWLHVRRNRLLGQVIAGSIEGRRGRRRQQRRQLLDQFKEAIGYCKLKEEALDRTLWITGCGRG